MSRNIYYSAVIILVLIISFSISHAVKSKKILSTGDTFPNLRVKDRLSSQDAEYLGLQQTFFSFFLGKSFSITEINAEVIVVEFFNKYCTSCQTQTTILNKVFSRINEQNDKKNRVKFLGIAAGNNSRDVQVYRRENNVPFPLVSDPHFALYEAIGDPGGTPFTIIVKKTASEIIVASSHMGLTTELDFLVKEIETALEKDVKEIIETAKKKQLMSQRTEDFP